MMKNYKTGDIVLVYSDKYDILVQAVVESVENHLLWVYYYINGKIEDYVLPIEVEKCFLVD